MPTVLPMTRVEAYLAYKAGVIAESGLKPSLKTNFYSGLENWLAYWCGLTADYPKDENNDPKWYNEEEHYVAYLCGIAQDYPTNCYRRVGAYLRHIISYRWPEPEKPLTREEYYLSLINSTTTSNPTPSSNFILNNTTDGAFQGVEVYGDTFQQTYTGKNLLNVTDKAESTSNGVTRSCTDGVMYLSGENTKTDAAWTILSQSNNLPTFEVGETYTVSLHGDIVGGVYFQMNGVKTGGGQYALFELSLNTRTVTFTIADTYASTGQMFVGIRSTATDVTCAFSIQIEKGSPATAYEPYVGGIPAPNPDYPQDIDVVTGEQTVTVTGKNLLPFTNQDFTLNSVRYYVDNGGLVLNGNSTGETYNSNAQFKSNFAFWLNAGTYTLSYGGGTTGVSMRLRAMADDSTLCDNINQNTTHTSFTLAERTQVYLGFYVYNARFSNKHMNVQLEYGDRMTSYQPYQSQSYPLSLGSLELCKIGTYRDYIRKSTGKNLFDVNRTVGVPSDTTSSGSTKRTFNYSEYVVGLAITNVYSPSSIVSYSVSGGSITVKNNSTGYGLGFPIKVEANTTYTASATKTVSSNSDIRAVYYQSDGTTLGYSSTGTTTSLTFTTPADCDFIVLLFRPANGVETTYTNVQLEVGSQATEYEPYGHVWYIHKNIRKAVLDGTEIWSKTGNVFRKAGAMNGGGAITSDGGGISSHFIYWPNTGGISTNMPDNRFGFTQGALPLLNFRADSILSEEDFVAWLANNPVTVYYLLGSPADETITDSTLISQLDALAAGQSYDPLTNFLVTATDPNLPALLKITAYKKQ